MGKVYSKNEIIKIIEEAKSYIRNFYNKELVNYSWETTENKQ